MALPLKKTAVLSATLFLALGAACAAAPVKEYKDIEYKKTGGKPILLDIFVPGGTDGALPPLVVYVHGGGWEAGSKEKAFVQHLVGEGFAVANIDYRLAPASPFPAQIQDCKSAVKFLRANAAKYGYDPARIGAAGESAGGHLVSLLGLTVGVKELEDAADAYGGAGCEVQAVCNMFGPTDFSTMLTYLHKLAEVDAAGPGEARAKAAKGLLDIPEFQIYLILRNLEPAKIDPADPDLLAEAKKFEASRTESLRGCVGGPLQEHVEALTVASPVAYVTGPLKRDASSFPPFLMLQADADVIVPAAQATLLHEALRSVDAPSEIKIYHLRGHHLPPEHKKDMAAFFNRTLKADAKKKKTGK